MTIIENNIGKSRSNVAPLTVLNGIVRELRHSYGNTTTGTQEVQKSDSAAKYFTK